MLFPGTPLKGRFATRVTPALALVFALLLAGCATQSLSDYAATADPDATAPGVARDVTDATTTVPAPEATDGAPGDAATTSPPATDSPDSTVAPTTTAPGAPDPIALNGDWEEVSAAAPSTDTPLCAEAERPSVQLPPTSTSHRQYQSLAFPEVLVDIRVLEFDSNDLAGEFVEITVDAAQRCGQHSYEGHNVRRLVESLSWIQGADQAVMLTATLSKDGVETSVSQTALAQVEDQLVEVRVIDLGSTQPNPALLLQVVSLQVDAARSQS